MALAEQIITCTSLHANSSDAGSCICVVLIIPVDSRRRQGMLYFSNTGLRVCCSEIGLAT
jgi:hypothetical protein